MPVAPPVEVTCPHCGEKLVVSFNTIYYGVPFECDYCKKTCVSMNDNGDCLQFE